MLRILNFTQAALSASLLKALQGGRGDGGGFCRLGREVPAIMLERGLGFRGSGFRVLGVSGSRFARGFGASGVKGFGGLAFRGLGASKNEHKFCTAPHMVLLKPPRDDELLKIVCPLNPAALNP